MKAIILLNGEPYHGKIKKDGATVFCCDGAYNWAKDRVEIDENVGDFDSVEGVPTPPPKIVFPDEKNMTDGEIALNLALERGAKEITFYGAGGKREDHFLGNLHLLYRALLKGVRAQLVTDYAMIFAAEKRVQLKGAKGRTLSIVPFGGDAHIIHSKGLKYPLKELTLEYGATRGISNVAEKDEISLLIGSGKVLVFVNFYE